MRLGLAAVKGIGETVADRIVAERETGVRTATFAISCDAPA